MLNDSADEEQAEERLKQLIEAIGRQDKDALREIFSKNALDEAENFDDDADDLFRFIHGSVESWEKSSGPSVYESINYGHITKNVSSYYYIKTTEKIYFFLMRDYPVDTDHPDNVGLYLLLAVREEDEDKIYDGSQKILNDGDQKLQRSGIYLPIK
ncbi:MAG: DUF5104 domain-containing protein [Clostridiales bacterium]|nr:DUF5104 domain-containing protein [Clostridiales bacterium]